jgi:hypothetical protein
MRQNQPSSSRTVSCAYLSEEIVPSRLFLIGINEGGRAWRILFKVVRCLFSYQSGFLTVNSSGPLVTNQTCFLLKLLSTFDASHHFLQQDPSSGQQHTDRPDTKAKTHCTARKGVPYHTKISDNLSISKRPVQRENRIAIEKPAKKEFCSCIARIDTFP